MKCRGHGDELSERYIKGGLSPYHNDVYGGEVWRLFYLPIAIVIFCVGFGRPNKLLVLQPKVQHSQLLGDKEWEAK